MLKSIRIKSLFLFVSILGSLTLSAQEQDISDTELAQFADAYINVQMQNQKSQQEMLTIIQEEGLEVDRFSEIQQATADPNKKPDASADELKKHASAMAKIQKLQPEMEEKALSGIETAGMTLERYESLATTIQQNQGLQQRLQTILMERQQN